MERPASILAVDDDPGILRLIEMTLDDDDFDLKLAHSGEEALQLAASDDLDAVLLDIMMPGMSGIEVLEQLRRNSNVPVILVTARDGNAEKVRGLDLGADDYISKPFSVEELRARIRAVLRRSFDREQPNRVITAGDVRIDLDRRLVAKNGNRVALTRTEWLVLQELAMNPGRTLLNSQILTRVWGPEYAEDLAYLRVWISRLRQKLENDPANPVVIKTVGRAGYVLLADLADAASL